MYSKINPITTYTSGDGKVTPIIEMNNSHLVNALLKTATTETSATDAGAIEMTLNLIGALKGAVLQRMDIRPSQA